MADLDPLDLRRIPRNLPSDQYKCGDEFKPFHPQASHVPPEYRDGWNRCWLAAQGLRDEALEAAAVICAEQGAEWDSDAVVTEKNYAVFCAAAIRSMKSGAAGEGK